MRNAINWFEIPTRDLDRATRFYEQLLDRKLRREVFAGTPIAIFTGESREAVAGCLISDPRRQPSADSGCLVYLDASPDLDGCLSRADAAGGTVVLPRTDIGEPGFIAIVRDTEGNHVGLHVKKGAP